MHSKKKIRLLMCYSLFFHPYTKFRRKHEAYALPVMGMGPSWPSIRLFRNHWASRDCDI